MPQKRCADPVQRDTQTCYAYLILFWDAYTRNKCLNLVQMSLLSRQKKKISVPNACIQNKRRRTGFLDHSSEYFELRIFYLYPRHSWETKNILFKSQVPQSLREGWDILSGSVWAEETSWTDFFKQILPKKKKDTQFWSAKI